MTIAIIMLYFLISTVQPIYANNSLILEIAGERKTENNFIMQNIELLFNNEDGTFLLGDDNGLLEFTVEDIKHLKAVLEKYLNWEEIAVTNQVEIYKEIPESIFDTKILYKKKNNDEYIKENIIFKMLFYSVNENEHYLVIEGRMFEKRTFGLLDEPYYISKNSVIEIYDSINEENIEKYIEEYENRIKIEELFK